MSVTVTKEMIAAAEAVDDLYRMGQPQLWARVFRAMYAAMPLSQQAQPAPVNVPSGWKLVPVEPTQEMHDAGRAALQSGAVPMDKVYRAMLTAAPAAPACQSLTEADLLLLAQCADLLLEHGASPYAEAIQAILGRVSAAQVEHKDAGWLPIETAPRDGKPILLGRAESEFQTAESTLGWWQEAVQDGVDYMGGDAGFVDFAYQVFNPGRSFGNPTRMYAADQPTHWMPLPPAPLAATAQQKKEGE